MKKAFVTLAFISQGVEDGSQDVMLQFYGALVKHFQFWSSCSRTNAIKMEKVKIRFTGCWLRGDFLELYKMMSGIDGVEYTMYFFQSWAIKNLKA